MEATEVTEQGAQDPSDPLRDAHAAERYQIVRNLGIAYNALGRNDLFAKYLLLQCVVSSLVGQAEVGGEVRG